MFTEFYLYSSQEIIQIFLILSQRYDRTRKSYGFADSFVSVEIPLVKIKQKCVKRIYIEHKEFKKTWVTSWLRFVKLSLFLKL